MHDGIILLLPEFFRVLLSYANEIELGLLLFKPHWDNEILIRGKKQSNEFLFIVVKTRHRASDLLNFRQLINLCSP